MEKNFAKGIYFNKKRDNAPDFVLGSVSIHVNLLTEWLKTQEVDEKGYLKLDIKDSKEGKPYLEVNTWKPNGNGNLKEAFPDGTEF